MNVNPKMLITGAGGFTGEHACEYFSQLGYDIVAVTRKKVPHGLKATKIKYCELTNQNEVYQLMKEVNPDYLLHLAGMNHVADSWKDPLQTIESNFLSTLYILDAVRKMNSSCKMIIAGSALQINPGEMNAFPHPYSLSKTIQVLISQAWAALYNMNIVIGKPSNIIGPGHSKGVNSIFANKIAEMEQNNVDKVLTVNNLSKRFDFIDVRDVVRAYDVLFNKGSSGEEYEISTGKTLSLGELIQVYKTLTDIDFTVEYLLNESDNQRVVKMPEKLRNLGWEPTISIRTSAADTLNYFRNKHVTKS